jgi:adenylate cyclase
MSAAVIRPEIALPKSELRLLGPLSVTIDGRELRQLPRKADALLTLLTLQPGRPIAREAVRDYLWTDRGPEQARHSLRQTLLVLRHSLGHDLILAEGNCLVIAPGTLAVDAIEFEARAASTDRDVLAEAAALYRGELLENRGAVAPRFDDWLAVERSRFAALAATILRRLAAACAAAGEIETAIAAAMRLVTIDNLREDSHRLLIELLARAGRRAEALRRFDAVAELLKRELGVRPDDETVALAHRIRRESSTPAATGQAEPAAPGAAIAIAETAPHAVRPPLPLPDKPSIAVLPFQNMSGDPEQEYFVDGMVEEIITALSRIRWLFVIARNSSFTYKGQAVDVRQVGRELGVRYVLEGSVRKAGNRVRISAQLIDAGNGAHLWADRFDGSLEEIFEFQDRVASSVAGVIEPALQAAEAARSIGRPTADLTAYDLYLRAHAMIWSSARQISEALPLLEQAIARDPCYGPALAWAAYCCFRLILDGRSDDPAHRLKGVDFARRALEVAGDDPGILANAAQALAYFGEDIGAMMALADRALALNPNSARGWHVSGVLRMEAGEPDIAIAHVETSLRLSPRARVGTALAIIGEAHFLAGRFDEAAPSLLLAIQEDPSLTVPYRYLAACYAHMGRLAEAREIVARLRAISSVVIPEASFLRNAEQRELYLSGLRLAAAEI